MTEYAVLSPWKGLSAAAALEKPHPMGTHLWTRGDRLLALVIAKTCLMPGIDPVKDNWLTANNAHGRLTLEWSELLLNSSNAMPLSRHAKNNT
jgi:hypothetical protein